MCFQVQEVCLVLECFYSYIMFFSIVQRLKNSMLPILSMLHMSNVRAQNQNGQDCSVLRANRQMQHYVDKSEENGRNGFFLFSSFSVVLLHLSITSVDVNFTGGVISVNRFY